MGLLWRLSGKEPTCQRQRGRSRGFCPWVRKTPWGRKGHPLQYSCLENPMDRGAWWAPVHRVTKRQTRLSDEAPAQLYMCVLGKELTSSSFSLWFLPWKNDDSEMLQYSCGIHSESRIGEYFSNILSHKKSFSIILFVYFPSSNLVCSFFFFFHWF